MIIYIPILFSLLFFFVPLFPDIKLSRPKLFLLESGLYGIVFLWLTINFYKGKIKIHYSLLDISLIVYGCAAVFFYFSSQDKPIALNEFKRSLLSIIAYFAAVNIFSVRVMWVFSAWLCGSFLASLYGLLQHSGGIWRLAVPQMDRVMSTFGNPIFFAAHLVITLPIAAGVLLYLKNKYWKTVITAGMICGLAALYYTQTRAAYIGFFISCIMFLWLIRKEFSRRIVLFIILTAGFIVFAINTKSVWGRHQEHLLIWRDTLYMWQQKPLIGTGMGTFHIYFGQFASAELKKIWPQNQFIVNDAHNEYLQILAETGILGLGLFVWVLIAFFKNAYNIYLQNDSRKKFLAAGLISSAAGIITQNLFSADMRFIISAIYLFFVMGLVNSFGKESVTIKVIPDGIKQALIIILIFIGIYAFKNITEPYTAQKKLSAATDFFDEKILEPVKTIAELEKIAAQYPSQSLIYEKMGWIYSKEKNWQKAIENYSKAAALNNKAAGPLNNLGNIYFLSGNRNKAVIYWNSSLKINPKQIDSRLNLAVVYYYEGQLKKAADQLKEVLKIDPHNAKAIVMLKKMTD